MVVRVALERARARSDGLAEAFRLRGKLERGARAGDRGVLLLRRRQPGEQAARLRELAERDVAADKPGERREIVRVGLQHGAEEAGGAGIVLGGERLGGGLQRLRRRSLGPTGPATRSMKAVDLALRQRAHETVERLAVLEGDDGGDRLDAELAGDLRVVVDVHLDQPHLALGAARTAFSRIGVSCWQGPHQGAQKSTSTGTLREASSTSARKSWVVVSLMRSASAGRGGAVAAPCR